MVMVVVVIVVVVVAGTFLSSFGRGKEEEQA